MFGRHPAILSASGSSASFMRALQPAAWFRADTGVTVTGQGVSTLADQSGNGRDLLQSTDASRPPYLSYTGTKYLYLPGVALNYASTPSASANQITSDIDVSVRVSCRDWTPAGYQNFMAKQTGTTANDSWAFALQVGSTGKLLFAHMNGITQTLVVSSAAPGFTDGDTKWVRFTWKKSTGAVNFYTAADSATAPTSWSQLGTADVAGPTTAMNAGTVAVGVGATSSGGGQFLDGNVYRAIIKNGIDGTTVVDFNPNLDASDGSTSFASSATGETWTVNNGSSGLIAYLVGKPWLMGDGSADILATSGFTLNQPLTRYIVGRSLTWTLNDYIADGNAKDSAAFIQSATTPRFKISAGSAVGENAGLALNTLGVMCAVVNGASSLTQVNLGTPVTGNAGAANAGGLTLFGSGTVATGFWNGMIVEDITFPTAHDATQRARVIQYLAGRHGIAL